MTEIDILRGHFDVAKRNFPEKLPDTFEMFIEQCLNRYIPDIEPEPVLVGYLNKAFGFVGYNNCKIGTAVYEYRGLYFFHKQNNKTGNMEPVRFYKETLHPCIKFLENVCKDPQ